VTALFQHYVHKRESRIVPHSLPDGISLFLEHELLNNLINMGLVMKVTPANIIRLWFGADTPIREYQIKMNPRLWTACNRVGQRFVAPSGAVVLSNYRNVDKREFARLVYEELRRYSAIAEEV
jgi:hypothetical protein